MSHSTTPSRFRLNSKTKEAANGSLSPAQEARAKSVPPDVKKDSKLKRSLMLNKQKSGEQLLGSQNGVKVVARSVNRPVVEQFAKPRRLPQLDSSARRKEEGDKELQERLQLNEILIKDLQSQVLALKAELDKAQSSNDELELQNKKLAQDLAAAEAKVAAFHIRDQESNGKQKSPIFKDIQKLIANKLENSTVKKEAINGPTIVKLPCPPPPPPLRLMPKAADAGREAQSVSSLPLPPPPPPPPPMRPVARAAAAPKIPAVVEFYHSLRKQEEKRDSNQGAGNQYKPAVASAHSSIVGEIQNRSAHLLAIKADVETKGDFINGLIQKVLAVAYVDIEDVLKFVDWLDAELSTLADERAVLKHFNWPERKADAIREAAIEYRALKLLENEISSFKDDTDIPCETALKKMAILLDRSERGIGRLIKLRNSVLRSYQDWKIPINWMLDSGIVSKIKQASMKLAKMYMRRVIMELELARNSDRESSQEALVLQGVHFAYRAHQFAGGLDSETLCAFEEIRQHVPGHLGRSRELIAAIPSS
ncbi:protein CHUP1, chloroplastic [Jatropha curcas]|uniref:protein CHUP1, chloroplastic n=1 Tax=Jatropha curcas TaxID=180498 RepID=UPI0005FAF276|nr:protein CHUP1, chloroplastic [Jatropha curcas]XP_020538735.1 protein CHUP1, chloroplastic [Jatropha curcas]XP_020538736.1 protein CHUP1, chloroplastic [Jatropha curcas]XP_037494848.1 protein CHUP1, chloroplastic [Jatropha curcas]XP_037494849.1 protein CHUP1, chloroplastic [Jatropha curcas]